LFGFRIGVVWGGIAAGGTPVKWTAITEDDARLHPLHGFGGWLYGVYAVEVLTLAFTLEGVVRVARHYGIEQLANPSFGIMWLQVALHLPFLLMAPMTARAMPPVSIACYWASVLFSLGVFVVPGLLMDLEVIARALFWIAWGVMFTLYLLRSRRVNVTYRHRVRADEPVLAVPPV